MLFSRPFAETLDYHFVQVRSKRTYSTTQPRHSSILRSPSNFFRFPPGDFRPLNLSLGVCANLETLALNESCNGTLTYAMYYSYIARFIDLFCELLSFARWKRYRVVPVVLAEFAQRANVDQCSAVTRRKERIRNRTKSRFIIVYGVSLLISEIIFVPLFLFTWNDAKYLVGNADDGRN